MITESRQATAGDARIAYARHGRGDPLVFVHAFPFDQTMWQPQVEALRDDYTVITVDLPGFGGSAPLGDASMAGFAVAVGAALDAEGLREPAIFVGLSMGGYVLFEIWRQMPGRVRALVLADTRAQADTDEGRANRYRTAEQVRAEGAQVVADAMLAKMVTQEADSALRDKVRAMMRAAPPEGIVGALHAMAARPDSTPDLEEISVPVLVIVGAQDAITTPRDAEAMVEAIAGAQLEVIQHAAHLSNVERPGAFNAALRRFIEDLDPINRQGWPNRPELPSA